MDTKRITIKTRPIPRRTLRYYVKGPLLVDKTYYWPTVGLLFANALACLEIVLKESEAARSLYAQVVEALELPGCQAILAEATQHSSETQGVIKRLIKAIENNQPEPQWTTPHIIFNRHQSNADFQTYIDKSRELILVGFNRNDENTKERPKVVLDKAPDLVTAIVVRSLCDHFRYTEQFDLARVTQYAAGVGSIMVKTHPPRQEQRIKHAIINGYESWKFELRHDTTILDRAWKWYQSRVVYAGPEEFCREYYNSTGITYDPANVDREIALPDKATGYPRKWRE